MVWNLNYLINFTVIQSLLSVKINFSKAIDAVLDQRHSVHLPGIGTIRLENRPSKISDDESAITPPSVILTHYNAATKNKALRKYLDRKYDLSKEKADEAINSFSKMLIKTMKKHGKVEIEKLMTIKPNGKKYQVKAKKSYLKRYYEGLPVIELKKIKKKDRKKVGLEAKSGLDSKKQKKKQQSGKDMKTAAAIATTTSKANNKDEKKKQAKNILSSSKEDSGKSKLVTKAVVPPPKKVAPPSNPTSSSQSPKPNVTYVKPNFSFPATKAKTPAPTPSVKKPAATEKAQPMSLNEKLKLQQSTSKPAGATTSKTRTTSYSSSTSSSAKPLSIKDPKPVGKVDYTPVPPSDEGFGCVGPALALLALLLISGLIYFGCNKVRKMSKVQSKLPATEKIASSESNTPTTTTSENTNNTNDDAQSTEIIEDEAYTNTNSTDNPSECTIITGVFSNYTNVSKMEEHLARNGYDVYISENGPYTRVGFTYDCSNVDLADYLNNIRRQIEPKAWYLVPELYVEYEY